MIRIFSKMGHSGGSASIFIPTLMKLLNFENLTDLHKIEDARDEWIDHSIHQGSPLWQNNRNSKIFYDGTGYYNVYHFDMTTFDNPNDAVLSEGEPR